MAGAMSINTELENIDTKHNMVVEANMHLGRAPIARVTVPPGEVKDICYGSLPIEENPDRPILVSVSVEGAAEVEKKYILPTLLRDNAKLVLNFENGKVTVLPVEGNIMARIGFIVKLKRTLKRIW